MGKAIRCQGKPGQGMKVSVLVFSFLVVAVMGAAQVVAQGAGTPAQGGAQTVLSEKEKKLNIDKINAELAKLKEETKELQTTNAALGTYTRWATAWGGAIGALLGTGVTLLIAFAGHGLNKTQREKMEQERSQAREQHLLEIFHNLGDKSPRVRLGAVAILVQRIARIVESGSKAQVDDRRDLPTMVSVLIAVSKQEGTIDIQKQIADGLAKALGAIGSGQKPLEGSKSRLLGYDFQRAKFNNAWWQWIDAREVDFYKAELVQAGLREAFLSRAVLYDVKLAGSTLVGAQLDGADLQRADLTNARLNGANLKDADLRGADLTGANLDNANLRGAKLEGAVYTKEQLKTCDTTGADFGPGSSG
jgi:hypothetical protein